MDIPKDQFYGITMGLPGSGKSSAAKRAVALAASKGRVIIDVNRDDIRKTLGGYHRKRENKVRALRDTMIRSAIENGHSVICSDTNLVQRVVDHHRKQAEELDVPFVIFDEFLEVPVHRCIQQDLLREESVGKDVIERMYYDYWREQPKPENTGTVPAIIVDIDGTLAHTAIPYPAAYDRDYMTDTLDNAVLALISNMQFTHEIIFVSGRNEKFRDVTERWLAEVADWPDAILYMRPEAMATEDDSEVKRTLYLEHIQGRYEITFVVDDRPRVVRMWRGELGLPVLQAAPNIEF